MTPLLHPNKYAPEIGAIKLVNWEKRRKGRAVDVGIKGFCKIVAGIVRVAVEGGTSKSVGNGRLRL